MFRPELLAGPRPAQVVDFLDRKVAVPLRMRSMYHTLRIAIGVELMRIPAIPAGNLTGRPDTSDAVVGSVRLDSEPIQRGASAN